MYAIIQVGGRQVRVEAGQVVAVDRQEGGSGDTITFDDVRFVGADSDSVDDAGGFVSGSPRVEGAQVTGVVEEQARGDKVRVFTKKRRKGMRRTRGHRTALTRVRITGIETK